MKLSRRLNALYELIDHNSIIADIGCDHGQLGAALILNEKSPYVYACDVNKMPLEKAQKLAAHYGISEQLITILSDGLNELNDPKLNGIVIAGMGYDTIEMILNNDLTKVEKLDYVIVQANNDLYKMRKYISDHHFKIIEEKIIYEDHHYYQLIKFSPRIEAEELTLKQQILGVEMIDDQEYQTYLEYQSNKIKKIMKNLPENHPKLKSLEKVLKIIEEK